jgi:type IV secretion system protein VirB2
MIAGMNATDTNAIGSAVGWLQGTLLGTIAKTVAIIAIAALGLLMLTGRVGVRCSAQVIFGCFIIFGASTIAGGILGAHNGKHRASSSQRHRITSPRIR